MFQAPAPYEVVRVDCAEIAKVCKKAKADLDAVWPQYLTWAKLQDERARVKADAEYERRLEKYNAAMARAQERQAQRDREHDKAIAEWDARFPLFRGPRPERPYVSDAELWSLPPMRASLALPYCEQLCAEDIRSHVDTMFDHATNARDAFDMTPTQFQTMLAWKEGRVVQNIRERMLQD